MNKPDFGATPTLASAFEHFLDQALFARRTRESYTDDLAPLLTPYGHAHVSVLTPELVQEYLARQERLAPATYNRRLAALRSFLNFLRAQGWQTSELLADVERKPERTRETRALDAGRVESVLRQITDPRDRALFWLIYDGGLRCHSWQRRAPARHVFLPRGGGIARQISPHSRVSPLRAALCHAS